MYPFAPAGIGSVVILFALLLPFLAVPFAITGYSIQGSMLLIHRPGWKTSISLGDLQQAKADPKAVDGSWRLCGNGGLFSFTGWFASKAIGRYRGFFTDPKRSVVLCFPKRKIVVSPEDPLRFVETVSKFK